MNNSQGFILIESLLALVFVLLLGVGVLKLVTTATTMLERGQELNTAVQIGIQECQGVSSDNTRYRVLKQRNQLIVGSGVSINKTIINIYDRNKDKYIMSFVVYE